MYFLPGNRYSNDVRDMVFEREMIRGPLTALDDRENTKGIDDDARKIWNGNVKWAGKKKTRMPRTLGEFSESQRSLDRERERN